MQKPLSLLMISFHFPPISDSSGYLRALKLAKYLPEFDIKPTILTVEQSAYEVTDERNSALLRQLNDDVSIYRTIAYDSSRQLAIKGKYFSWMAIPDKWVSWIPFACYRGWRLNHKQHFDALWVTYPISSALFIGYFLSKLLKKPMYVDLRDPVWEEETWQGTTKQKLLKWIENKVIERAQKVCFTAPGTIEKYKRRYSSNLHSKFELILNGYDEQDFENLPDAIPNVLPDVITNVEKEEKKVFLHSGVLPVYERDPSYFFKAISALKKEGAINNNLVFRLRATGNDEQYISMIKALNIADLVEIKERTDYSTALIEMYSADFLMIFQHRTCDWQIPAKLFEYFRVNKPLLILAGKNSDTLAIVEKSNCAFESAEIDEVSDIKAAIIKCLHSSPKNHNVDFEQYSRKYGAQALAKLIRS